ncbi:chaperone modulator CbpM [Leifsonia naganoensis]|uniref:DNA-binding transcriptional MerR regulator n=1 Tax=Leifsonia naganoensis TaxID=150025 RepID=A0A853DMI8_9MICO|nr:chaperone modulator CbpM [Leifsonia naganoensis]NYK09497.1 DNA-binding transcriptional MerR regulator [Leifsonia naganoensis]
MSSSLVLALPPRLDLGTVAAASGIHPDLVRRFVDLGLVPAWEDASGRLWFSPATPGLVRRIVRLHADLSLNYAAVALVIDLLARIDALENRRRVLR